jgi:NAD(P)-dependent dehydrogenase (short-subunit alcohol dehydrogenase family)
LEHLVSKAMFSLKFASLAFLFLVRLGADAFETLLPKASQSRASTCLKSFSSVGEQLTDRRGAFQWTGAALASLLLGQVANAAQPKTILITGSNSGIGFEAAKILAGQGHTVVMACRTLEKAKDAIARIQSETSSGILIPKECNLASLESIKSFVQDLPSTKLDVICLNAGLARNVDDKEILRTAEGFELTVGVNYLGHFYLTHLLLPKVEPKGGRVVVTASGVHDPDSPGGGQGKTATLGTMEGFERDGKNFDMVDGQPYNGDKAYKDSKVRPRQSNRLFPWDLSICFLTRAYSHSCVTYFSLESCSEDWKQTIPLKESSQIVSVLD